MRRVTFTLTVVTTMLSASASYAASTTATPAVMDQNTAHAQLGPRPFFLIDDMKEGKLKEKLKSCANGPFTRSDFSIGHRGAAMQFPEHTRESYIAAAKMGAGILECDVTFTKDTELVCRHSQCDLATTTNILATPLAAKCSVPFQPAQFNESGELVTPATAKCCTSDITLAEFKTLTGKMDASNKKATTVAEFLNGTASWRTDLYASRGTVMSHKESIELFKALGTKMTPELKAPSVKMPFNGFSQTDYAQKMINEYKEAGVPATHVWPQSFNIEDVRYWIKSDPLFAQQAVYLDGRYDDESFDHRSPKTWKPSMEQLVEDGVNIIAPPMWMLLDAENGKVTPSTYAKAAKAAGLKIITWTLERSGHLNTGGGWYYQTLNGQNSGADKEMANVISTDGDMFTVVDVLAKEVGIIGLFSDWPATTTYYANCMKL